MTLRRWRCRDKLPGHKQRDFGGEKTVTVSNARNISVTVFLIAALTVGALASETRQQDYDVIISGGRILDGTGNPWFTADVGISRDRVLLIDDLSEASAPIVLDATGLYVTPGFIDVHSHAAEGLTAPDRSGARTLITQGLTTVVVNPDGRSPDIQEQRYALGEHGLGVNVAQMVGHGSTRRAVIGMEDRQATPEELNRMRDIVRVGMGAGPLDFRADFSTAQGATPNSPK